MQIELQNCIPVHKKCSLAGPGRSSRVFAILQLGRFYLCSHFQVSFCFVLLHRFAPRYLNAIKRRLTDTFAALPSSVKTACFALLMSCSALVCCVFRDDFLERAEATVGQALSGCPLPSLDLLIRPKRAEMAALSVSFRRMEFSLASTAAASFSFHCC